MFNFSGKCSFFFVYCIYCDVYRSFINSSRVTDFSIMFVSILDLPCTLFSVYVLQTHPVFFFFFLLFSILKRSPGIIFLMRKYFKVYHFLENPILSQIGWVRPESAGREASSNRLPRQRDLWSTRRQLVWISWPGQVDWVKSWFFPILTEFYWISEVQPVNQWSWYHRAATRTY